MRIHYLSSSHVISDAANAVHVMKMCQAFAANGHAVTLSAREGRGDEAQVFAYYGIERRFPLLRHDESGHPIAGALWSLRRRAPSLRVGGLASLVYGRLAVAPLIHRAPPELVYARNIRWLAGIASEVPFIAEAHQPPATSIDRGIERRLYRRRGFRRLVVISEKLKEIYLSMFPALAGRVLVAHDAADDPAPPPEDDTASAGFQVGYVGHLYPGRGTEIIRQLARDLPEATFHVVGGTDEDRERLAAGGLTANVILHGHHPPSALGRFYREFDVVLAPYQRSVEVSGGGGDTAAFMSPLKLFEYMSWAKPILCSDLPVLREVLEDGRNALLLPPEDASSWAAALRRLMNEVAERRRLGCAARADFLARHTWRARAAHVLENIEIRRDV